MFFKKTVLILSTILAIPSAVVALNHEGAVTHHDEKHREPNALLIFTTDKDWKEKWEAANPPHYNTTETIKIGGEGVFLIFLQNVGIDSLGNTNIVCDIKLSRPNGTAFDQKNIECLVGKLKGPAQNVYLSKAVVKFIGETSDPIGDWVLDVMVKDLVTGISTPVSKTVKLEAAKK